MKTSRETTGSFMFSVYPVPAGIKVVAVPQVSKVQRYAVDNYTDVMAITKATDRHDATHHWMFIPDDAIDFAD